MPMYGSTTSRMTQRTLPKPEMSLRRNRSLAAVMNSQNQRMNMNIAKASATKLANAESLNKDMLLLPRPQLTAIVRGIAWKSMSGASLDRFRYPNVDPGVFPGCRQPKRQIFDRLKGKCARSARAHAHRIDPERRPMFSQPLPGAPCQHQPAGKRRRESRAS